MSARFSCGGFTIALMDALGPERAVWEWRLLAGGLSLPMTDYWEWSAALGLETWFLGIEDSAGRCMGGLVIRVHASRAMPGFKILRVERLGGNIRDEAYQAVMEALAQAARWKRRVLRLHVELFSPDPSTLARLGTAAGRAGMAPSPVPRCYGPTTLIDVSRDPAVILAGFNSTARQNIRAVAKHPVEVRPVIDPELAGRLNHLLRDTMLRTGGTFSPRPWDGILRYSGDRPDRSRVVGLFRTDQTGPEALIAFAWGCFHGDHVQYSTAATVRSPDIRMPMAYCLAWDLMQWAHGCGARYFDFGGITEGSQGGTDPLGGISDFKRYFRGTPATVGTEWILEPHPSAAAVNRMIHRLRSRTASGHNHS